MGVKSEVETDTLNGHANTKPDAARVTNGIVVGIPTYNEEVAIGSIVLQAQRHAEGGI